MKIETKFDIGDEVYFIHDNKVDSSFIVKIKINIMEDIDIKFWMDKKQSGYILEEVPIIKSNNEIFKSKQELIDSL